MMMARNHGGIDEAKFRAKLEGLLHSARGNLRQREHQLLNALTQAMKAAGYAFKRVPVRRDLRPPTVEEIMSAPHRFARAAVRLLRSSSSHTAAVEAPPEKVLDCFGSRGKQRDHVDEPLMRRAPATFTPVMPTHAPIWTACRPVS